MESVLVELVDGDLEKITAATVYEGVVLGDAYAHEVMKETAKFLGVGVANLINAPEPGRRGHRRGVTRAGDHLFVPLRKRFGEGPSARPWRPVGSYRQPSRKRQVSSGPRGSSRRRPSGPFDRSPMTGGGMEAQGSATRKGSL